MNTGQITMNAFQGVTQSITPDSIISTSALPESGHETVGSFAEMLNGMDSQEKSASDTGAAAKLPFVSWRTKTTGDLPTIGLRSGILKPDALLMRS